VDGTAPADEVEAVVWKFVTARCPELAAAEAGAAGAGGAGGRASEGGERASEPRP
jgi:hypothetical protein